MERLSRYLLRVCTQTLWISGFLNEFHAGTAILLKPGIILGGPVSHDCPLSRSVGYFLEPVIMLAPFSKKPLQLTLRGVTTDDSDLSVWTISFHSIANADIVAFYRQI